MSAPLTADDLARLRSGIEGAADRDTPPASIILALLDMVTGLQALVRGLASGHDEEGEVIDLDAPEIGLREGVWMRWAFDREYDDHIGQPLADVRPDLAALLTAALEDPT